MKKITDNIIYHMISTFMYILGLIPKLIGDITGDFLGNIWFVLDKKHRRLTINNIKHAFKNEKSDKEITTIARYAFKNTGRMLFEHTRFHRMKHEDFHKLFSIKGLDILMDAHAEGKGIIGITGHLGNWELLTAVSYLTNIRFSAIYKTIEFAPLDRYMTIKRSLTGCEMLPLHNALDGVKNSLAKGDLAGLIIDQNVRKRDRGVFIDFFNRKACANKGPARLALSTQAPVIPVFLYRDKKKFTIEVFERIPLIQTGDLEKDILDNTQVYHSIIEENIRKHPEQYFWQHNRWKTRPLEELPGEQPETKL